MERLTDISKFFYSEIHNLPSYDEFNQQIRESKMKGDKEKVYQATQKKLSALYNQIGDEITSIKEKIHSLTAPAITSEDKQDKLFGAIEVQTAMRLIEAERVNIEDILKSAFEKKRFDFLFEVEKRILSNPNFSQPYKMRVKSTMEKIRAEYGLTELETRKKELEMLYVQVGDYLNLLNEDPAKFEAKLSLSNRVTEHMRNTGQLKGDSVVFAR